MFKAEHIHTYVFDGKTSVSHI